MKKILEQIKEELVFNSRNIKLPIDVYIKINKYSDLELQQKTGLLLSGKEIREYIYILLIKFNKQVLSNFSEKKVYGVKLPNIDKGIFGFTLKTIDKKNKRIRGLIIDFLLNENIIRISLREITPFMVNNYDGCDSVRLREYELNNEYISEVIDITLEEKKTIKIQSKLVEERVNKIIKSKSQIAKTQLIMNNKHTKLDREYVFNYGVKLIGKEIKGKIFTKEILLNHMIIFDYLLNGDLLIPIISKESGRVFTSFNLVPSWIRELYKINGFKSAGRDIKSSIPSILNKVLGGKRIDYIAIQKKYKISYSEAKLIVLEFIFSSNGKNARNEDMKKINKYFEETNKELLLKLKDIKKGKGMNKVFANRLFKIESDMMNDVIKELRKLNIYVYYIFDELIGKEKDLHIINLMMTEMLEKYEINTYVK